MLTNGLDDSYDLFIISLDSMPVSELTLEHVSDWLLKEEMECTNRDDKDGGVRKLPVVFHTSSNGAGGVVGCS